MKSDRQQDATGQEPSPDAIVRPGWSCGRVFRFDLAFPPSANTYYRTTAYIPKEGRPDPRAATYLSAKGRAYRYSVCDDIEPRPEFPLACRVAIDVSLYFPTKRRCDIDNRLKPLLDALEYARVFHDDSQVDCLRVSRGVVRKGGRCLVTVVELIPDDQQQELPL